MVGGKDELQLKLYNAICQACFIAGELWVAISTKDYDFEDNGSGYNKIRFGDVVGVAVWYPDGTDFLAE